MNEGVKVLIWSVVLGLDLSAFTLAVCYYIGERQQEKENERKNNGKR